MAGLLDKLRNGELDVMSKDIATKSIDDIIQEWNIHRLTYVSVLFIFWRLSNLLDGGVRDTPRLMMTVAITVATSIIYILYVEVYYKRAQPRGRTVEAIHMLYWTLMILGSINFYVYDAQMGNAPVNMLVIYGILVIVPVFTTAEAIYAFGLPMLINLFLGITYHCDGLFFSYTIVFAVAATILSITVLRRDVQMIGRLQKTSNTDSLTGLLNRQAGVQRAIQVLERCKRDKRICAVYMIDIDLFKRFNDTYGHLEGDQVLRGVADKIRETFSRGEDVFYRYGGEEFLVCIATDERQPARDLAERLRHAIEAGGIGKETVTVSVGLAFYGMADDESMSIDTIVNHADEALYAAKANGRNQVAEYGGHAADGSQAQEASGPGGRVMAQGSATPQS